MYIITMPGIFNTDYNEEIRKIVQRLRAEHPMGTEVAILDRWDTVEKGTIVEITNDATIVVDVAGRVIEIDDECRAMKVEE